MRTVTSFAVAETSTWQGSTTRNSLNSERGDGQRSPKGYATTILIRVSTRSASAAGLSVLILEILGNRIASPDLWRLLAWIESKATSSTSVLATSRTGPKRWTVL